MLIWIGRILHLEIHTSSSVMQKLAFRFRLPKFGQRELAEESHAAARIWVVFSQSGQCDLAERPLQQFIFVLSYLPSADAQSQVVKCTDFWKWRLDFRNEKLVMQLVLSGFRTSVFPNCQGWSW